MKKEDLRKRVAGIRGLVSFRFNDRHKITFYDHPQMIIGIDINIEDKFWNKTKEVLLTAIWNGYEYRLGLDEYKSERSLVLRINNFVKYIIKDNVR